MKEHSFFLQIGFTPKDSRLMQQANAFRMEFDRLLADAIYLSNGVVSNSVLKSGEVVTPFTLKAEMASAYFTGVNIPIRLTEVETGLMGIAQRKLILCLKRKYLCLIKEQWD